jgi:IS1 family transposase/transposase-like protein
VPDECSSLSDPRPKRIVESNGLDNRSETTISKPRPQGCGRGYFLHKNQMANILPKEKQLTVLNLLVEGNSLSSTSRLTGVHRDTCSRLMVRFGTACKKFLDRELRDLQIEHIELDEIWTFNRKKRYRIIGNEPDIRQIGDIYIFVALDEKTRLIPSHRVGKRDQLNTNLFVQDLSRRIQIPNPHQSDRHAYKASGYRPVTRISTDGFAPYVQAIDAFFGPWASYGVLEKNVSGKGRKKKLALSKTIVTGKIKAEDISTSLVERNNLTTRTFMRRLTRKSIAFSKKLDNLRAATAMFFCYYNYCWKLKTLKTTPAVAAGVVGEKWKLKELYSHVQDCSPELFL